MKIVVLGGPGAGKGTQLARISQKFNMVHISTGNIFRDNISRNTELGVLANSYISKGNLVPDDVTCKMLTDRLREDDCRNGYALDGFPRTIDQALFLEEYMKQEDERLDAVIDIEVDDDIIIERLSGRRTCLKCGATYHIKYNKPKEENICDICKDVLVQRKDDSINTINSRLEVYHRQTEPLKEYYKGKGNLIDIDGNGSADEVEKKILEALGAE